MSNRNITDYYNQCSGHFSVGVVQTPFLHVDRDKIRNITTLSGFEFEILNVLSTYFNFRVKIIIISRLSPLIKLSFSVTEKKNYEIGNMLKNKTWTGLVGSLVRKEIDIAISSMIISAERMEAIDFTETYLSDRMYFHIKSGKHHILDGYLFLKPFHSMIWILLIIYVLLFTFILKSLLWEEMKSNWLLFYLVGSLSNQSVNITWSSQVPKLPVALVVTFGCLITKYFVILYGCKLTSTVSVANPTEINTLADLANLLQKGKMIIGAQNNTFYYHYVANDQSGTEYGEIFRKVTVATNGPDYMPKMLDGKLAYVLAGKMYDLVMFERGMFDKYHRVKEPLCFQNMGMATTKNFTCRQQFSKIITDLRDTGCLHKWQEETLKNVRLRQAARETFEATYIKMIDLESTFWLGLVGLNLALLVLAGELLLHENGKLNLKRRIKINNVNHRLTQQKIL